MKRVLALVAVLAMLLAACATTEDEEIVAEDEEIVAEDEECPLPDGVVKAVVANDVQGIVGPAAPENLNGLELAIDRANEEGGVLGCRIELDVRDDQADAATGAREIREAILTEEPQVVFGPFLSDIMLAIVEVTSPAGVPFFSIMAGDHLPVMDEYKEHVFMVSPTTFTEGRASGQFLIDLGECERYAVVTANAAYGRDFAAVMQGYIEDNQEGAEFVASQFPDLDETDYGPFIEAVVSAEPDCVFGGLIGDQVPTFYRQWIERGLELPTFQPIYFSHLQAMGNDDIPPNTYGTSRGYPLIIQQNPLGASFLEAYEDRYNETPSEWSFIPDCGVAYWKAAVEAAGGFDSDDLMRVVRDGEVSFDCAFGPDIRPFPLNLQADLWVNVGVVVPSEELGRPTYDLDETLTSWARDVWLSDEELTDIMEGRAPSIGE